MATFTSDLGNVNSHFVPEKDAIYLPFPGICLHFLQSVQDENVYWNNKRHHQICLIKERLLHKGSSRPSNFGKGRKIFKIFLQNYVAKASASAHHD